MPRYIGKAIKSNPEASSFFQKLTRRERRNFVVRIHIPKRPETRERRIRESIALLAAGRKLGLKSARRAPLATETRCRWRCGQLTRRIRVLGDSSF